MEDCVFRESGREDRLVRSDLTVRERQVLDLVEGKRNKEIALEVGHPAGNGQDSPQTHLRKDRRPWPLRPGAERIPAKGVAFGRGALDERGLSGAERRRGRMLF